MKLLFSLCGLLLYHGYINSVIGGPLKGVDYKLSVLSDDVISRCDQSPNNFVDKLFDLSNLTMSYDNDGELLVKGTIKYIGNFKADGKITLDVQVFRRQRGQWMPTVYNFYRQDFCGSIWNSIELWYKFTVTIPEEMRICPPDIGSTYDLDFYADLTMKNIPDRNAAGDYKAQATITYGAMPGDYLCLNVLGYIEKI